MKLTINTQEFLKGLTSVSKTIQPKPELPVLANVKMSLTEKGLELLGSDGNMCIKTTVPFMIGEKEIVRDHRQGDALVNAKTLIETVGLIESEEITIELIDNSILRVKDNAGNTDLPSVSADEYPNIDLDAEGAVFTVKTKDIEELVDDTAFAASNKEIRPILTAINLVGDNGMLIATATDTARLARKKIAIDSDVSFTANIPAKKMIDIVHSFNEAETVDVSISDKKALFSFDNTVVSTRLLNDQGDYPNTKSIVPTTFNYFLQINAKEFLNTIKRASVVSADQEGVVKLMVNEESCSIGSKSAIHGSTNYKVSTFQFSGDRLVISFKSMYVADAIRALKSEDVTIAFLGEMKPFVVRNDKDDALDMLITPLRSN